MKVDLKALNQSETEAFVRGQGLEPYRATIRQWIFKGLVTGTRDDQHRQKVGQRRTTYLPTSSSSKPRFLDHDKLLFRLGDGPPSRA
jgi:hypothetical protein